MKKTIQTRIDANGDVHLDFEGFVGRECQVEEDRLRRELATLGLNVAVTASPKKRNGQTGAAQSSSKAVH